VRKKIAFQVWKLRAIGNMKKVYLRREEKDRLSGSLAEAFSAYWETDHQSRPKISAPRAEKIDAAWKLV
jgi:hypothetical protein